MIDDETLRSMPQRIREIYEFYKTPGSEYERWEFTWDGATLAFVVPDHAGMCDFCGPGCSGAYSVWDAENVILLTGDEIGDGMPHESTGPWHACIDCTPLVAAANREALLQRALRLMRERRPAHAHPAVIASMRACHAAFWRAKRSP